MLWDYMSSYTTQSVDVDDLVSLTKLVLEIISLSLMTLCFDKNWGRLLGLNLPPVLLIFLRGILRSDFWILVS